MVILDGKVGRTFLSAPHFLGKQNLLRGNPQEVGTLANGSELNGPAKAGKTS